MRVRSVNCYLVYPGKHSKDQHDIVGSVVPKSGKVYDLLEKIFRNAENECTIGIIFNPSQEGKQQNDCRDLFEEYIAKRNLAVGRKIAQRLQESTTHTSGLGLLFIMYGESQTGWQLMLSRFPADQGILAEERSDKLSIEFVDQIFLKSASAYKAAVYSDKKGVFSTWTGKAIDKQINLSLDQLAQYWIGGFLNSSLATTPAEGTRRLASSLGAAIKTLSNPEEKSEIGAAATLASVFAGKTTTIKGFCEHFGMRPVVVETIRKFVKSDELFLEKFQFEVEEFRSVLPFRTVELNNGGIMTADAGKFDDVFHSEPVEGRQDEIRYVTQGKVVQERLKKART